MIDVPPNGIKDLKTAYNYAHVDELIRLQGDIHKLITGSTHATVRIANQTKTCKVTVSFSNGMMMIHITNPKDADFDVNG
jgi:hypothetical protein